MQNDNFETPPPRKKANRKRPYKNKEKRLGAREIVRRTEWLKYPLFYWPGDERAAQTIPKSAYQDAGSYSQVVPAKTLKPILQLVFQRLHGMRPGLYALHMVDSITDPTSESFNPQIPTVISVSKRRLARTNYAFEAASKYPKALPGIVGDVQSFHNWVLERLHIMGTAIRAAKELQQDPDNLKAHLCLQEVALGVYPLQRPSISPNTLGKLADDANAAESRVKPGRRPSVPVSEVLASGMRAAAIIAGQQGLSYTFPPEVKWRRELGRACKGWPVELLATLNDEEARQLLRAARGEPRINSRFTTGLFYEFRLALYAYSPSETERSGRQQEFIHSFGSLVSVLEQLGSEPERRRLEFYQLLRYAFDTVCGDKHVFVDAPGRKLAYRVKTTSIESSLHTEVFERTFSDWQSMNIPEGEIQQKGISYAALWHTGYSREIRFWKYMADRLNVHPLAQVKQEVLEKIKEWIETKWQNPADSWMDVLIGITGRLSSVVPPVDVHRFLSGWTEVLRSRIPIGPHRDIPFQLTCAVLFSGKKFSNGDIPGIRNILMLLNEFGHQFIFPRIQDFSIKQFTYHPLFLSACTSGNLQTDEFRACLNSVFEFDLEAAMTPYHYHFFPEGNADGLVRVINFFRTLDSIDSMQTHRAKERLVHLLMFAEHPLPQFVTQWLNAASDKNAATWELMTAVVDDVHSDLLDDDRHASECSTFLEANLWILDQLLSLLLSYEEVRLHGEHEDWQEAQDYSDEVSPLAEVLFHNRHLSSDALRLISRRITNITLSMLRKADKKETQPQKDAPAFLKTPSFFSYKLNGHQIQLCSLLADEDPDALVNLLYSIQHSSALRYLPYDAGFNFLSELTPVKELLKALAQRPEHYDRLWYLVRKTFFLHRLQLHCEFAATQVPRWQHPQLSACPDTPLEGFLFPDAQEKIDRLYTYSLISERAGKLPKTIRKIIAMPRAIRNEHRALQEHQAKNALNQSAEKRLQKVTALLYDPEALKQILSEQLDAEYEKQLLLLKTEALTHILDQFLENYWYPIIGSRKKVFRNPNWDNAFYLYFTTDENKRPLRRLLQALAQDNFEWPLQHPSNKQFLDEFAQHGADPAEWLKPVEWKVVIHGNPYHLYIEPDPLKVLQMGNYFDTCLSTGSFNSFSTIANAVEVNKQVIYMRDSQNNVVARKLIAVTKAGFLGGFNTYVSDPKLYPLIKIYMDLVCLDIAERAGLSFLHQKDEKSFYENDGEEFKIFCAWYFDGLEEFDWWMEKLSQPGYGLERLKQDVQEKDSSAETEDVSPRYSADNRARLWIETVRGFQQSGSDAPIAVVDPVNLKRSSVVTQWSST
jgi:hypothetical protein